MQTGTIAAVVHDCGHITEHDIYLFKQGSHFRIYNKLGAHITRVNGVVGTHFAVWAPNALGVSLKGDFNGWNGTTHQLRVRDDFSGIWEGFIPGMSEGSVYKYHIVSRYNDYRVDKADPIAFCSETPPKTASVVRTLSHDWGDGEWMEKRHVQNSLKSPYSIYEVHLGSWRRVPEDGNRPLDYRELATELVDYVVEMGFTHVELLPVMEHPFYGSWGYQTSGYFAPTSRYGAPADFMYLIDKLHQNGIGVILDWVPSHFPTDAHGLGFFDGTHLYEHADPRIGFHPDWTSFIFNYSRNEVRSFLISSAVFWLDKYHVDGIRVDAVASMLYLDYSREDGEWIPNVYGGNENIAAISLLKRLNETVYENFPDVQTMAEESTDWPMVSKPTYLGGLGFGMKWSMGWMHDTLNYISKDPIHRKYSHSAITFSIMYAFNENFLLPFSHDEVVYGKGSLVGKMPGDEWQRFANLRLLCGYMYGHPGKKLLFMGCEFGQVSEWAHDESLDWNVLKYPVHRGAQRLIKDLNRVYREEPALYELDFDSAGFEWIDFCDWEDSVISFIRRGETTNEVILVISNFTPVVRHGYRLGVPESGRWKEILNTDALEYNGSGKGNLGSVKAVKAECHGRPYSIAVTLPPLSTVFFKWKG